MASYTSWHVLKMNELQNGTPNAGCLWVFFSSET